jgi:hypothetical protein
MSAFLGESETPLKAADDSGAAIFPLEAPPGRTLHLADWPLEV